MYNLKVSVNKLNIRSSPLLDQSFSNWAGDMSQGETHTGQRLVADASGRLWWQSTLNRYTVAEGSKIVSLQDDSAGVNLLGFDNYIQQNFNGSTITGSIDYNLLSTLPTDLKSNQGQGVSIAIMDSGIPAKLPLGKLLDQPLGAIDPPATFHGAFIAGLIGGASNQLKGIAPQAQIIDLPIYNSGGIQKNDMISAALNRLSLMTTPVVVNISQEIFNPIFNDQLQALPPNVFLIASGGEGNDLFQSSLIYPASQPEVIAVGALSNNDLVANSNKTINSKVDFFFNDFSYVSFSLPGTAANPFIQTPGDSCASAIVSGMAAILLSAGLGTQSTQDLKGQLRSFSRALSDKAFFQFLNPITPS